MSPLPSCHYSQVLYDVPFDKTEQSEISYYYNNIKDIFSNIKQIYIFSFDFHIDTKEHSNSMKNALRSRNRDDILQYMASEVLM